ncbi:hypothetical protein [Acinetobacter towneri]|uniref:Uncharacterized protein n=1 Tax=Acinetobacter towneri TaxID=202956 RepID=A0AAP9GTW5_9GAMM|nr:hypothetical protein [Acinetobacter towneri]QGM27395.1 hypothetical protein GJD93_06765 [Acinetobacter towneri]
MATDVDVQYFSHLNGLVLGNNWGDLIRLLDKALVTGIDFTQITAASIDAQGDVHITLYAAHNAMLFQVVELTGFAPASFNQKYRIKGVPNTTQLILKPHAAIAETSITTVGAGKLASLGYEIIFRDTNDVKRVYRAKNPTEQHPYIRVDESIASDTGSYASTYAKYAMVGLLEHMDHIDDYENHNVLQLPFDPANPAKNWKITGSGTGVVRGWSRWYWAALNSFNSNMVATTSPATGQRGFTLLGDQDAFYLDLSLSLDLTKKGIYGCGIINASLDSSIVRSWFLMSTLNNVSASTAFTGINIQGGSPIANSLNSAKFLIPKYSLVDPIQEHTTANPIVPDYFSGRTGLYDSNNIAALEIPISDDQKYLRGHLKHIHYCGNIKSLSATTPILKDNFMYVGDNIFAGNPVNNTGAIIGYLGEL